MKIKVILTGGTVGSEKVNGVVKNNKDSNIASMWKEKFNSNIDFDVVNLYSILSENIKTENIEMLFAELRKDYSDYKGIIITHGSDTLSYTSAFVSIFCKNYKIPVVLTGADKVLSDPTSNGYSNFTTSVELIMDNRVGVWTVFDSIFSADTVMEADYFSDKFRTGNSPLTVTKCSKNITFNNKVAIIKMYPFINFSMVNFTDNIKACLLVGYHSGTADENAVDTLLSKCKEKNIPLYLQGLNKESALYDSSNNLQEKGVNLVYNSTPEYAYATLMIKVNS